jgi:hypothetical protein
MEPLLFKTESDAVAEATALSPSLPARIVVHIVAHNDPETLECKGYAIYFKLH